MQVKLTYFNRKHAHVCLFYCTFLGSIWFITSFVSTQLSTLEKDFSSDIQIITLLIPVKVALRLLTFLLVPTYLFLCTSFWLSLFLLLFHFCRVEILCNLLHCICFFFFFSLLYGLVFLSDLNVRCWKLYFITGFGCEAGKKG